MTNNPLYAIIYIILYNKDIYNKYYKYIYNKNNNYNKEIKYIISLIKLLYEAYPEKESFSVDDFEVFFKTKNLGLTEKQYVVYNDFFTSLRENKADPQLAQELLQAYKKQQILSDLALYAWDVQDGSKQVSELSALLAEIDTPLDNDSDESLFVTDKLSELVDNQSKKRGLRWRVNFLNLSLGSIRKGHFGFVFARPETGKTTFLASEVTFMAEQLEEDAGPILWFNNEQEGEEVMLRLQQAAHGVDQATLKAKENVERFEKEWFEKTHGKIKLIDRASLYRGDVEAICRQFGPSLVIFDQIDKIKGFDSDREDLRLGAIYVWARELAKEHCPVIGVCQADGTGEGQKWLTMDNVSNAKTSKQAEADWILGIGKTHDRAMESVRYFNISKNKLPGDSDTISRLRHGQSEILIEADIGRYRDIVG